MNCWIHIVMIIDGNISVDIYCVPEWTVGYIQWWSLMATIFLWTFAVCLNEHIHTVMIIDGNNISVDIYCVPNWTVGYIQWWSFMATTFLWTFTVCLNELWDTYSDDHWWQHFCGHLLCAWMNCWIRIVMIIDGSNISVDIYYVPKWTVGWVHWHDPR